MLEPSTIASAMQAFLETLNVDKDRSGRITEVMRLGMEMAMEIERLVPEGDDRTAAHQHLRMAVESCCRAIVRDWEPTAGDA